MPGSHIAYITHTSNMWKQLRKLAIFGGVSVQQKLRVRQRGFSDTACVFCRRCSPRQPHQSWLLRMVPHTEWQRQMESLSQAFQGDGELPGWCSPHCFPSSCFKTSFWPVRPTFRKIHTVILKLRSERAPGIDGISVEMLVLGGAETICWLKTIFEPTWVLSQSQRTGRVNSLCRCTCNTGE